MVKQYGQLWPDTRHALLETEDAQTAGMMARQLLLPFFRKSPETILADRDLYASEQVCRDITAAPSGGCWTGSRWPMLGEWEFDLPLRSNAGCADSRDDTCAVARLAIWRWLGSRTPILVLCCGSGCIGLAIASRVKDAKVTLAD